MGKKRFDRQAEILIQRVVLFSNVFIYPYHYPLFPYQSLSLPIIPYQSTFLEISSSYQLLIRTQHITPKYVTPKLRFSFALHLFNIIELQLFSSEIWLDWHLICNSHQVVPRWHEHWTSNKVYDGDMIVLQGQEKFFLSQSKGGSGDVNEQYTKITFTPTQADRFVLAFRKWLRRHGNGQPDWFGTVNQQPLPSTVLSKREVRTSPELIFFCMILWFGSHVHFDFWNLCYCWEACPYLLPWVWTAWMCMQALVWFLMYIASFGMIGTCGSVTLEGKNINSLLQKIAVSEQLTSVN